MLWSAGRSMQAKTERPDAAAPQPPLHPKHHSHMSPRNYPPRHPTYRARPARRRPNPGGTSSRVARQNRTTAARVLRPLRCSFPLSLLLRLDLILRRLPFPLLVCCVVGLWDTNEGVRTQQEEGERNVARRRRYTLSQYHPPDGRSVLQPVSYSRIDAKKARPVRRCMGGHCVARSLGKRGGRGMRARGKEMGSPDRRVVWAMDDDDALRRPSVSFM